MSFLVCFRKPAISAAALSILMLAFAQHASAADPRPTPTSASSGAKVGFVSLPRIMRESQPVKAAEKKIDAEFTPKKKEVDEVVARLRSMVERLEKDAPVIPESERNKRQREIADLERDLQRRQRSFNEDLNQRRSEELAKIEALASQAIRKVASAEQYDIIFQEAVYASPRIDITEKVVRVLNGQSK